ncbi:MAG: hypothetical protein ACRELV_14110 [Longimicrobiales bacterium]
MTELQLIGAVAALGIGLYIGLGFPGLPGRQDRVTSKRRSRRRTFTPLDWIRPPKR